MNRTHGPPKRAIAITNLWQNPHDTAGFSDSTAGPITSSVIVADIGPPGSVAA